MRREDDVGGQRATVAKIGFFVGL